MHKKEGRNQCHLVNKIIIKLRNGFLEICSFLLILADFSTIKLGEEQHSIQNGHKWTFFCSNAQKNAFYP